MFHKKGYRFLLSSLILLSIIYVLSILKVSKDTLIVTNFGAEFLSTIKLYGVLPSAFLFTLLYTKLTNYFTRIQVFHLLNWIFVIFFVAFGVIIYPNASHLHLDFKEWAIKLPFLKYHIIMLSNWSYSLFYICSELWGSVMVLLMFWQLMNQIYKFDEARRIYPLLNLLGQIGAMISGLILAVITLPRFSSSWDICLKYICISTIFSGAMISLNLHILSSYVVGKEIINGADRRVKEKLTMIDSFKYVFRSKHIMCIGFIMMCYGASMNMNEMVWKKYSSILYPDFLKYCHFNAKVQIIMSIITIIVSVLGSYTLPKISWRFGALITPLSMIITGVPFFITVIYYSLLNDDACYNILVFTVYLGAVQNIIVRSTKYSFFEPTKEMVFILLDDELKSKGKGVVDIMGERFGKASSSAVQWFMLSFIFGSTLITLSPYLFIVFLVIMIVWTISVFILAKEMRVKSDI